MVRSDNAKNFGWQTNKAATAACVLMAYYHNDAQSGKDTHFPHQQMHVDNYLVLGEEGRKVSTPKQLAVALMENRLLNTTVLLVKA